MKEGYQVVLIFSFTIINCALLLFFATWFVVEHYSVRFLLIPIILLWLFGVVYIFYKIEEKPCKVIDDEKL